MADLFSLQSTGIFRLLDPGAGIGSLTAAVCDRFLKVGSCVEIEIHLFENDSEVLPFLHQMMERCAEALKKHGHMMRYEIHDKDFILDVAAPLFGAPSLFAEPEEWTNFDAVITNPPYFKLNKDSHYARLKAFGIGSLNEWPLITCIFSNRAREPFATYYRKV